MNHTIKGIIIVVAITSILVLGASMFPIMQNSFAHKRSYFKGADRDPNTNTSSNSNTADSSSSSDATADNTNNITNSATASNSQEQDACAVALTCTGGSTTVTPPATGTLEVTKFCPLSRSCIGVTFSITVTGTPPVTPSSFTLVDGQTQAVTLGPGSFTVHEAFESGFIRSFEGDCTQIGFNSPDATGTISAGQTLHCTIHNLKK
jgi:hypothetical protein